MNIRTKPYQTKEEKIYRTFTDELEEWSKTGVEPSTGNQDIRYYLELQEERLRKRNLKMEYRMRLRGEHLDKIYSIVHRDQIYTNILVSSSYSKKTAFYREGKKIYEKTEPQIFCQTITKMDQQRQEQNYCCPNCSAVSPVGVLLNGCPHCHTRFLISDLFPKVTGYYFEYDFAMNKKEAKVKTAKWIMGGIIAVFLMASVSALLRGEDPRILMTLIGSFPIGAAAGYFAMSLCMALGLFGFAGGNIPRLLKTAGTKGKLTRLMQPYDKSFSYEYFTGRILSLIKMIIYADNTKNLAVYEGDEKVPDYSDIVESVYRGSMGLSRKWIENGYCYLDLNVYMTDTYDAGRIYRKNDQFHIVVCRKLQKDSDLGFSIKKVQCAGCGGSFDATRQRRCPYCDREYHLRDDDWVVIKIRKK